jgi:hypothetical protein
MKTTIKKTTFNFGNTEFEYVDSKEDLQLEIKPSDIANSNKLDPNHCVAACAMKRQYGTGYFMRDVAVIVKPAVINGKVELKAFRYRFSKRLAAEVKKFDETGEFELGTYKLKAITPSQTLEAKRVRSRIPKTDRKRTVRPHHRNTARGKMAAIM